MSGHTAAGGVGVRIAGSGRALPERRITNADLEKLMETSHDWIVQRTGIHERRMAVREHGESVSTLAASALRKALIAARMQATDLDLIVLCTMTPDMTCPPSACLVANNIGATGAGGFDLNGACSGFVFGLNVAHDLIKVGTYRSIGLVGADTLTKHVDYTTEGRSTAILFGDGAGAVILRATDDRSLGLLAQSIHVDGSGWKDIYIPQHACDFPAGQAVERLNHVHMAGSSVFKFAVGTFPQLIAETLEKAKLPASAVDLYVCHQSNARILKAAREKFNLEESKLHVNIDHVGNTVAASVPICFDELVESGRVKPGMKVMFLGFGGGLTWGSSLWQF